MNNKFNKELDTAIAVIALAVIVIVGGGLIILSILEDLGFRW